MGSTEWAARGWDTRRSTARGSITSPLNARLQLVGSCSPGHPLAQARLRLRSPDGNAEWDGRMAESGPSRDQCGGFVVWARWLWWYRIAGSRGTLQGSPFCRGSSQRTDREAQQFPLVSSFLHGETRIAIAHQPIAHQPIAHRSPAPSICCKSTTGRGGVLAPWASPSVGKKPRGNPIRMHAYPGCRCASQTRPGRPGQPEMFCRDSQLATVKEDCTPPATSISSASSISNYPSFPGCWRWSYPAHTRVSAEQRQHQNVGHEGWAMNGTSNRDVNVIGPQVTL
jgi:hypothetical protein